MTSIFCVLAIGFAALYYFGLPVGFNLRNSPLTFRHKTALQNVNHRVGVFGLFGLLFIPLKWLFHSVTRHRILLLIVFIYTFIFFNPQQSVSSAKESSTVHCPDRYAYRLANGHYIRCEDFDLYHEEEFAKRIRKDLYLDQLVKAN